MRQLHGYQALKSKVHLHLDEEGKWVRCYHSTRSALTSWGFWVGITFSFPLEHMLWEKVWPFNAVARWMGL